MFSVRSVCLAIIVVLETHLWTNLCCFYSYDRPVKFSVGSVLYVCMYICVLCYVGTGSLLIAAAHFGACTFGTGLYLTRRYRFVVGFNHVYSL